MRHALATLLVACAVAGAAASAETLDVLAGSAGAREICGLGVADATEIFGIPSRILPAEAGLSVAFAHHGLLLDFEARGEATRLRTLVVYAVDRPGFSGYRGHFMGTIASGTRSAPVVRLLRSARAEITRADEALLRAQLGAFTLEIGFVHDMIDWAMVICAPGARATDGGA